ncbi:condensation domain-containing protein, partial [Aliikangiella sp. G2MR2-5]|uniref:condensation domain-containing protein n=1 Tax=Aliikangiella sp. G2MR2-5 TaxID=2788943 RepID=UPI0018A9885F
RVGIHDSFFRLGGNSMVAMRMMAACQEQFNKVFSLQSLYQCKSVSRLAEKLEEMQTPIAAKKCSQGLLSFAQQSLFYVEQFQRGKGQYHIPFLVMLKPDVNYEQLETAFQLVIKKHNILNTVYQQTETGNAIQSLLPLSNNKIINFHRLNSCESLHENITSFIRRPFNLETEPSIKINVFDTGVDQYLLIVWHHISFDGWSIDVFMRELAAYYNSTAYGNETRVSDAAICYQDYAFWQHEQLSGNVLERLKSFWQTELQGAEPLALPTDYERPALFDYEGAVQRFSLAPEL